MADLHDLIDAIATHSSIDEILELFDNRQESWEQQFEDCLAASESCSDELATSDERLVDLVELRAEVFDEIQKRVDALSDDFDSWCAEFDDAVQVRSEKMQEVQVLITQLIRDKWTEISACGADLRVEVCDAFEQHLEGAVEQIIVDTGSTLEDTLGDNIEKILAVGDRFNDALREAFAGLRSYVGDELINLVEEETQKMGGAVLERVKNEIVEGVMTSQIQVQITSMLSSVLPQLAAAKALAPAIRQSLEIMRMGF